MQRCQGSKAVRGAGRQKALAKVLAKDIRVTRDIERLQRTANDEFAKVRQAEEDLEKKREDRIWLAKAGNAVQVFMSDFSKFLEAYSGISNVAKAADAKYGGLVTESLSLLLVIGMNKQGRETAITAALHDLTPWLLRLELYQDAFRSSEMDKFIEEVYLKMLEFLEESCRYFSRKPIGRFWEAIRRPPNLGVDVKVAEIKDAIFQVTSEGHVLLISRYEARVCQEVCDRWTTLKENIGLRIEDLEQKKIIEACQSLYMDAFRVSARKRGKGILLQQADVDLLHKEGLFDPWHGDPCSSLLLLTGENFDKYKKGSGLCWLSSAALDLTKHLLKDSQVLFYSGCRDEDSRWSTAKETIANIFASFVFQILEWDEAFFLEYFKIVEQRLKDPAWKSTEVEEKLRKRGDIVILLLNSWTKSKRIYFVIDRIDKFDHGPEDTPEDLIEEILKVVSKIKHEVKVFIVASSLVCLDTDDKINTQRTMWHAKPGLAIDKERIFGRGGWHQCKIRQG